MPQREHLHRLGNVWLRNPLYFLTVCVAQRRAVLNTPEAAEVLVKSWHDSPDINGWVIGRYVIMPDHVHFFARAQSERKTLPEFMRDWKRWTANQLCVPTTRSSPLWQPEYFDHVLRSAESYSKKWDYVRANPVRAELVPHPAEWAYSGECEKLQF